MAENVKEGTVDLQNKAGAAAIDTGQAIIVLVVAAAVTLAVIGGDLIYFVQQLVPLQ